MVDKAEMARRADELLSKIGVSLDVSRPMHELSTAQEQLVQIAAAVGIGPRIVVFDEPTSSLAEPDAQNLFKLIESLKAGGHDHDLRLPPDAGVVSALRQDQRLARWPVCGHPAAGGGDPGCGGQDDDRAQRGRLLSPACFGQGGRSGPAGQQSFLARALSRCEL